METWTSVLLLLVAAAATTTTAQVTDFYCLGNTTYAANSTFSTNLQTALSTLSAASSTAKFSNTTVSGSTLHALYFCRYDLPLSTCHQCVSNATTFIISFCPTSTEAIIWYEHCTLYYAPRPLNKLEHPSPQLAYRGDNFFLHVTDFNWTVVTTLQNTIDQAISTTSNGWAGMRYFAMGEGVYGEYQKVYCLVQCTPDISAGDCGICLEVGLNATKNHSLGYNWGMVFKSHCMMRFGVDPFYTLGNASDGAVSPTASISGGSASSPPVGSASSSSSVSISRLFGASASARRVISGSLLLLWCCGLF